MDIYQREQLFAHLILIQLESEGMLDSPNLPDSPSMLNVLGFALSQRFQQSGNAADLDRAILALEAALQKSEVGSKTWLSSLNNLGNTLQIRYEQTADLEVLNRAIRLFGQL